MNRAIVIKFAATDASNSSQPNTPAISTAARSGVFNFLPDSHSAHTDFVNGPHETLKPRVPSSHSADNMSRHTVSICKMVCVTVDRAADGRYAGGKSAG